MSRFVSSTAPIGVLRVGGTRVPLATVVEAFREGATPEEIVLRYPSLDLADVYSVIGYFLHHRAEVEAYLANQRRQSEAVRAENEANRSAGPPHEAAASSRVS